MMSNRVMPANFHPTASWENLRLRAELLRRLREFFDSRGFLEVETPILSADTVVDRHLDPFCVEVGGQGSGDRDSDSSNSHSPHPNPLPKGEGTAETASLQRRMWLQTSPEFAMKRMLAAGAGRIYQVARVFRLDELGPLHNPEFTLVEWYQPGDGLEEGMQMTSDLCEALLSSGNCTGQEFTEPLARWVDNGDSRVPASPGRCPKLGEPGPFGATAERIGRGATAERIRYGEAFERYVGVDPHRAGGQELAGVAKRLGVDAPASLSSEDRDGWLDLLMVERIQPHLGVERPALLYEYPASQAALARVRCEEGKSPVAERFELYIGGVEIANGYHELLDPAELRARNATVNAQRRADGKAALPEESRLLAAMESGLPASVGVALGFDRLVMAALGAKTIAEVIAFPFDRA
jgi:elongation factor P--(R)-beta-lysine ligase